MLTFDESLSKFRAKFQNMENLMEICRMFYKFYEHQTFREFSETESNLIIQHSMISTPHFIRLRRGAAGGRQGADRQDRRRREGLHRPRPGPRLGPLRPHAKLDRPLRVRPDFHLTI